MTHSPHNRFEDFFTDDAYVALKNQLYNYLLRKRAINAYVQKQQDELILEVGSGLSPMVTDSHRVIYSDLSLAALQALRRGQTRGEFVVADAMHLPFRPGSFPQVICSEVLEHLPDDRAALRQITSVMKPGGSLIITFPHRLRYFAVDDRFVNHFRRYELSDMENRLREVGLHPVNVQKVLGPMEKLTMMAATAAVMLLKFTGGKQHAAGGKTAERPIAGTIFKWLNLLFCPFVWLDARLAPRFLSAVLLIRSVKES
jgi:SAM-dependent methyltransferase